MVGVFLDDRLSLGLTFDLTLLAIGVTLAIAAGRFSGTWIRMAPWCMVASTALTAAALGALRYEIGMRRMAADHVARWSHPRDLVLARIVGEVVTPPRIERSGDAGFPRPYPVEPKTRFYLDAQRIQSRDGWVDVSGRLYVTIAAPALDILPGQTVEAFGRLYRFRPPDNPGEFDGALWQRRHGVWAGLFCSGERNVHALDVGASGGIRGALQRLRRVVRGYLIDDGPSPGDAADSLLEAMVLGQRGRVERSLDEAFRRAGVVHFLCASGIHVAWLGLFAWGVLFACGAHYRTIAWGTGLVIIAYAIVAEPNPPILRAAIIGCFALAAQWLRRPAHTGNWLAASAIVLLLVNPGDLFNPGFQLSFAAILGIRFVGWPLLQQAAHIGHVHVGGVWIPALADQPARVGRRIAAFIAAPVCIAFGAWAAAFPIVAFHFGWISPWGWLNSAVLAPFVFATMALGFSQLLLAAAFPSLGGLLAAPLGAASRLLAAVAGGLADIPGGHVAVMAPGPVWTILFYASLLVVVHGAMWRVRRWMSGVMLVGLMAYCFVPSSLWRGRDDALRIWMLSVGDGNAVIIELPNGRTLACDLGTRAQYDLSRHTLVPFLRHRGVFTLDDVMISHPDMDHYGAVAPLSEQVELKRVWINDHFRRLAQSNPASVELIERLEARAIPIRAHRAGDRLPDTGDVTIDVIWPTGQPTEDVLRDNDTSTVLRIVYQDRTVLLTGDVTDAAQARVLERGGLKADVLQLPHHGSPRPRTTAAFIDAVDPTAVIRSSGRPDRETNDSLWRAIGDRAYYNTAECGAVCVTIQNGAVRVTTFGESTGRPVLD
ncbi:MAG: ComEC/Rec2 family competence protein [Phycisphaerae bacterium]